MALLKFPLFAATAAAALLLGLSCSGPDRPPADPAGFNGRWNITVKDEPQSRAWWLEVTGAGTPQLAGKFVGAPGGGMYDIPEMAIENGRLRFVFERDFRPEEGQEPRRMRGVWTARLEGGKLQGTFGFEGSDQVIQEWTGEPAPAIADRDDGTWQEGAPVELFNGKDLSGWQAMIPGRDLGWSVANGILKNQPHANNLVSQGKFWNFILRTEYRLFEKSNSGIGLRGRYEIQILDDFGRPPSPHGHGSIYSRVAPAVNASRKPGEWQQMEIRLVGREVTVTLNGQKLHDKVEIEGLTAMASDPHEAEPGPITIQGDHEQVEFRRITLIPLEKP